MSALEQAQAAMIRAIACGPAQVPDDLFAGGRRAALRGLAVHANTISHARLVALEDTFPRTRALLGQADFNAQSRAFVERGAVGAVALAGIGQHFPAWLADHADHAPAAGLARFEWAWLQGYHAAEAPAFTLADLAALPPPQIAGLVLARHPASHVVDLGPAARTALANEAVLPPDTAHALITRPEADVRIVPATAAAARLHAALATPRPICNLLAEPAEPGVQDALLALIASGALVRVEEEAAPC